MLSEHDYTMAWSIYVLCAAVMVLTVWRLSIGLWFWLADAMRGFSAVILFTPVEHTAAGGGQAPAIFMLAFELLAGNTGSVLAEVGIQLLLTGTAATLGLAMLRGVWKLLRRRFRAPPAPPPTAGFRPRQR